MKVADRIAKLRRMAEHPTSNPHEAAIARAEMERLLKAHPDTKPASVKRNDWRPYWADAARFCFLCSAPLDRVYWMVTRCPTHAGDKTPGEAGYYEWAKTLNAGDRVLVSAGPHGKRFVYHTTIERVTKTQYVVSGGDRFRRAGQYPGYKCGEDGRSGRSHFVWEVIAGRARGEGA